MTGKQHRHVWDFDYVTISAPRIASPRLSLVYRCRVCRGTRTVDITPRIPSPVALTDEERFEADAIKAERARQRNEVTFEMGGWAEGTDALFAHLLKPEVRS